jgi:hypothetical protein
VRVAVLEVPPPRLDDQHAILHHDVGVVAVRKPAGIVLEPLATAVGHVDDRPPFEIEMIALELILREQL